MNHESMNEIDIGYMQVHLRIYENSEFYDSFAINAKDDRFTVSTELVTSCHQVIGDPANVYDKIFQIELKIVEEGATILLHMPIHQSDEWEVVNGTDKYVIGFFCNLNENDT